MARKLIAVLLLLAVFLVGVPLAAGLLLGADGDEADGGEDEDFAGQLKTPQTITIWLTDEERDIFLRGRNAKKPTKSKNASVAEYNVSTGFEAVIGFLYLVGDYARIEELLSGEFA